MSITPEVSAKTLTQLVATEIRVAMTRADKKQSDLARELGKNEQWLSVRLRGRQPIDLNDLNLIARALGVGVHTLLPPPDVIATAATRMVMERYRSDAERVTINSPFARQRPNIRRDSTGPHRTARLPRGGPKPEPSDS